MRRVGADSIEGTWLCPELSPSSQSGPCAWQSGPHRLCVFWGAGDPGTRNRSRWTDCGWMESVYTPLSTNQGMEGVGRREKVAENPRRGETDLGELQVTCLGVNHGKDTVESSRWCFSTRNLHTHTSRASYQKQIQVGWVPGDAGTGGLGTPQSMRLSRSPSSLGRAPHRL